MSEAGMWYEQYETPVVYVREGYGPDDWKAELYFFYPSNNIDIANLTAYGSTFDGAIANMLRALQQLGYRDNLTIMGEGGEEYGSVDFAEGKPKVRLDWQVDWTGLLAGEYSEV